MRSRSPWKSTLIALEALLQGADLHVVRSFDLQVARQALLEPSYCPCPHHGTERCNCQYLVLLIYGERAEPVTLTVHGHDDRTDLSIESIGSIDQRELEQRLRQLIAGSPTLT